MVDDYGDIASHVQYVAFYKKAENSSFNFLNYIYCSFFNNENMPLTEWTVKFMK
jgi:hypothetical protein